MPDAKPSRPEEIAVLFGRALRAARHQVAMSQEELAGRAGVDRVFVSELERGLKCATLKTVAKLAHALRLAPSALLARAEELGRSTR